MRHRPARNGVMVFAFLTEFREQENISSPSQWQKLMTPPPVGNSPIPQTVSSN